MARINPFVHFNGNAEEAFTFYKSVFGGSFSNLKRYKEISSPEFQIPENDAERIMHISLPVGGGHAIMGSDVMEMMGKVTENDNRNTISISADSREEADKLFNGLSEGGTIEMPIADGPTGSYFGMFADKFGVQWMVDYTASK
ncbi:MAG: VOC family protein [Chitinophagaceae bacterium]|nr:MAG: VOC family protein [Chitinophagaceae bacterium]